MLGFCNGLDLRIAKVITQEARHQFSSGKSVERALAMALVVSGGFSTGIVSLFLKYAKPPIPIQMFFSKEKAIDWLKTKKK
ncbi:MAG: hypothetical protein HRT71_00720 [Flavobacteriales bacterium]|nr:hypothetical protein [Flavobacteriales bacterium]